MAKKQLYKPLSKEEYDKRFKDKNNEFQKEAFKKAWELRSFEIDKFWHRSAYFWGFIAFIFGGYIAVVTGKSIKIEEDLHLVLYLILLGIIFSVGWLLVIRGSIQWQNNWEAHIDELEDEITGPLYKTVYYKGRRYYSVSKISETLACVIIVVWCILLVRFVFDNYMIFKNTLVSFPQLKNEFFFIFLPILAATFVCVYILFFKCKTANGKVKADKADFEGKPGVFLERVSGE